MAIEFEQIPVDLRVPLFYAEVDNTRAGSYAQNLRSIIFGYVLPGLNGNSGKLQPIATPDQALIVGGWGSMLARQVRAFRNQNPFGELWVYPMAEPAAGEPAIGTITFSGTTTEAGHIYLYVAGQLVQVPIPAGTADTSVATLVRKYIVRTRATVDVLRDLPVTATNIVALNPTNVLTFTAKNKGTHGNAIDLRINYNADTGEKLPAGITATVAAMSGGTGVSSLTQALAAIGDEPFEYYVTPFNEESDLQVMQDHLESRWGPMKQLFGSAWTAKQDTYASLYTLGNSLNHKYISLAGYQGAPTWEVEVGAAYGGVAARYLTNDPARQLGSLELNSVLPPPVTQRFTIDQMNNLMFQGITPLTVGGGDMRISRSITTYQVNEYGAADDSWLETTRNSALARIIREVHNLVVRKYPRVKVLPDGDLTLGAGQAFVTPKRMRADLVAHYGQMCRRGLCQRPEAFERALVVQIDSLDHTRMNILYPPVLVNPLNVVAVRVQFRF